MQRDATTRPNTAQYCFWNGSWVKAPAIDRESSSAYGLNYAHKYLNVKTEVNAMDRVSLLHFVPHARNMHPVNETV